MIKTHIRQAIRLSSDTSPGPEGIPYAAWRQLGVLATGVLHDALIEFSGDDAETLISEDYPEFNESLPFSEESHRPHCGRRRDV